MPRAIFIDRDGVICHNRTDHVKSWAEFAFLPTALAALESLAAIPLPIVVITNQAAINRGIVSAETVDAIHAQMRQVIHDAGGRIDRIMVCPHRPDEQCSCRKPQPGLLLQAAQELQLDLVGSYLIGDALTDIAAGQTVGCRCFLVLTGRGPEQWLHSQAQSRNGFTVADDLQAAARSILRLEQASTPPLPSPDNGKRRR